VTNVARKIGALIIRRSAAARIETGGGRGTGVARALRAPRLRAHFTAAAHLLHCTHSRTSTRTAARTWRMDVHSASRGGSCNAGSENGGGRRSKEGGQQSVEDRGRRISRDETPRRLCPRGSSVPSRHIACISPRLRVSCSSRFGNSVLWRSEGPKPGGGGGEITASSATENGARVRERHCARRGAAWEGGMDEMARVGFCAVVAYRSA